MSIAAPVRIALAALLLGAGMISARAEGSPHDLTAPPPSERPAPKGSLHLSAKLVADGPDIASGIVWRVFDERTDDDGSHRLVAQSTDAAPTLPLQDGRYVVHCAYGFASAMRAVTIAGGATGERMTLNAGGLSVKGVLADTPIAPDKLSLAIYVPDHGNAEAKLVVSGVKPGQIIRLPEGQYHVVSTYLDTVGVGSLTPVSDTNSVVSADLRVQPGKLIEATVTHRAAVLTLKLVNVAGGEALANTSFTILTPGGDIIRELIGAFPSLVLAEGDYLLIARHNGQTYQSEFKVQSALDRDIEVLASNPRNPERPMQTFFVEIKCALGRTYAVASALAEAEIASEIYSIAGNFDILAKFYVEGSVDIGHFVGEHVHTIPGIVDTRTIITFKAF